MQFVKRDEESMEEDGNEEKKCKQEALKSESTLAAIEGSDDAEEGEPEVNGDEEREQNAREMVKPRRPIETTLVLPEPREDNEVPSPYKTDTATVRVFAVGNLYVPFTFA